MNPQSNPQSAILHGAVICTTLAATVILVACCAALLSAQSKGLRTPDGHPDLQGFWDNSTLNAKSAKPAKRPVVFFPGFASFAFYPENPTQRPPAPTPNQSSSDTTPTNFSQIGLTLPSPASVTLRRTVSAKIVPSSRHDIFHANGVL